MKFNKISVLAIMMVLVMNLVGCTVGPVTKTLTYSIDMPSGSGFFITIKTSGDEKLHVEMPFIEVRNGDEILSSGYLVSEETAPWAFDLYDEWGIVAIEENMNQDPQIKLFEEVDEAGNTEWNYLVKFQNAPMAMVITNTISEESARHVMSLLEFKEK